MAARADEGLPPSWEHWTSSWDGHTPVLGMVARQFFLGWSPACLSRLEPDPTMQHMLHATGSYFKAEPIAVCPAPDPNKTQISRSTKQFPTSSRGGCPPVFLGLVARRTVYDLNALEMCGEASHDFCAIWSKS